MIPYIGDISKADAEVLRSLAMSNRILEFGCGASTQVIARYFGQKEFTSVDTSQEWIDRTKRNLLLLEIDTPVTFVSYDEFKPEGKYDFIFIDGADNLRRQFALDTWHFLDDFGFMAFHDTRRPQDFRNLIEVQAYHQNEISRVEVNCNHSNISIIFKKPLEQWENWQITEHKLPWMLGYGHPDIEYIKSRLHQ